ncbi:MAG: hypothetical protein IH881_01280 [Myxococcales bacterium]|nr:hypothetical protein [Myxococcales bacterium]
MRLASASFYGEPFSWLPSSCQPSSCRPSSCQPSSCQPSSCQPSSCQPSSCQPSSCRPSSCRPSSCQPSSWWPSFVVLPLGVTPLLSLTQVHDLVQQPIQDVQERNRRHPTFADPSSLFPKPPLSTTSCVIMLLTLPIGHRFQQLEGKTSSFSPKTKPLRAIVADDANTCLLGESRENLKKNNEVNVITASSETFWASTSNLVCEKVPCG